MSETTDPSVQDTVQQGEYPEIEYVVKKRRRSPLQRIGCIFIFLVWLMVMMIPFGVIALVVQGNITIAHMGDMPDKHEHPRFQVHLISEIDYRGLQLTRSTLHRQNNNQLCVQTNVSYLLWQGEGEPATYCDCYTRAGTNQDWQFVDTTIAPCE